MILAFFHQRQVQALFRTVFSNTSDMNSGRWGVGALRRLLSSSFNQRWDIKMSLTVLRFASVIFQETPSGADYLSKLLEHQYLLTKPLLRQTQKTIIM